METTLRLQVKLNKFPDRASRAYRQLSQAVRKTAFDVEARAKGIVPVRTGNLKNSIQTEIQNETNALVQVGARYGIYVEYGTRRMSARPYMRPAVEAVREAFVEACRQALRGD